MATVRLEDGSTLQIPDGSTPDQVQTFVDQAKSLASAGTGASAPSDPGFLGELANQVKSLLGGMANSFQGATSPPSLSNGPGAILPGAQPIWNVGKSILESTADQGQQVMDAITGKGAFTGVSPATRATSAVGHTLGMVPMVGPALARGGENLTQGNIGAGVADLAPLAISAIAGKIGDAWPSAAKAGDLFDKVDAAAGQVPIDVSGPKAVAVRSREIFDRGEAQIPAVLKKFYDRVNDPNSPPMTFGEARDFQIAATGKLSPDEIMKMTPRMARQVGQFKDALTKTLTDAASTVNADADYTAAIKEFRQANKIQGGMATVRDLAFRRLLTPKGVLGMAGTYELGKLGKDLFIK